MSYTYKVRELGKDIVDEKTNEVGKDVGASEEMQAMSLKKLKAKLDHKKEYPSAGHYQFVWNPRNASGQPLAAGTYILTIMHQNKIQSQKITFLK